MSNKNNSDLLKTINNKVFWIYYAPKAFIFPLAIFLPTNIISVLPLEKLQSSKIFVASNLQIEIKAAEQRNINKHSKPDVIQNLIR